ncbi:MAG: hypothetical protein PGN22_02380 [Agrobacterium cavarae]
MSGHRSKYIDPDFRRDPKSKLFCVRCQKDIKDGQSHLFVCYEFDTMSAVHPDDWEKAMEAHPAAFAILPIGKDCAKKIGIQYTATCASP